MGKIKCFSNVECQICHTKGMLQIFFNSSGKIKYARIRHYEGLINGKPKFHYCKQPNKYAEQILNDQNHDHNLNNVDLKLLTISSKNENNVGRDGRVDNAQALRAFNWSDFKRYVYTKYRHSWSVSVFAYSRKYYYCLEDPRELINLPKTIVTNVIKSLIILAKYQGKYNEFKEKLKNYGIKCTRQDSFKSFLRILNANNNGNNILNWIKDIKSVLTRSENTFIKFCLYTGLRKSEAIISFNKIIELNSKGRLNEYYDQNLNCLLHFKYPEEFIRKTKNCFISFVKTKLINEIANSKPVYYNTIRRRLKSKGLNVRFNEFRDFYGTYLLQHGILEVEINLLQGRIPPSIFIKHYWTPKLTELRDRVFEALRQLQQTL